MEKEIDFTVEGSNLGGSQDLNYSFSVSSQLVGSMRRSRGNSNERGSKFVRRKSKESTEKFRCRVKSL